MNRTPWDNARVWVVDELHAPNIRETTYANAKAHEYDEARIYFQKEAAEKFVKTFCGGSR